MIKLALEKLVDDVAATFAAEAGQTSFLETANFSGTAALSGTPTDLSEVEIRFTTGGSVGVAGIVYDVSTDDGLTRSAAVALGELDAITVSGVTVTISGAIVTDDVLRWQTTSPVSPALAFGSREPPKRGDGYKISWVPGDEGDGGEVTPPKRPGENPRSLYTFNELVTVYVEASTRDSSSEIERAQYRACRLLLNAFFRAVYKSATIQAEFVSVDPMTEERKTRRHGWAYRVVIALESKVPDAAFAAAPVNVNASVTTTLGDQEDGPDIIEPSGE